jgi:hypothetical protein
MNSNTDQKKTEYENFSKKCQVFHSEKIGKESYRAYEKLRREEGLIILLETIIYVTFIFLACLAIVSKLFSR